MSKPFTTEKFINDAIIKFSHKFDYSKVQYRNATTKVTIICPKHGEFNIGPWKFLNSKHGCKQCAIESMAAQQKKITRKNLEECKKRNSDHYEYPEFPFNGIKDKIPVMCNIHGIFHVSIDHHLRGVGCKKCADSNKSGGYSENWFNIDITRKSIPGQLYILEVYNEQEKFIKVGITKNSIGSRYRNSPYKKYNYSIIHQMYGSLYDCFLKEKEIKTTLQSMLYQPANEYYYTESFNLSSLPKILEILNS